MSPIARNFAPRGDVRALMPRPLLGVAAALIVGCAASVRPPSPPSPPPASPPPDVGALAVALALPEGAASSVAPMSLTAEDGTGLALAALRARAVLHGPLVETELALTFENPHDRRVEGRFRLALPPRAFTSRLAMKIDGRWTEADVAETAAAREVYEDALHRRRDPLLVEQRDDNELTARVFPIEPREKKEIVVAWIAEVGPDAPVIVPLRGLGRVERVDASVVDGATEPFHVHAEDTIPREDARWAPPHGAPIVRAGDALVARVRVPASAPPAPIGPGLLVLVETSASRAPDLEAEIAVVRGVAARLGATEPDARVVVAAFDQDVEVVYDGALGGLGAHGGDDVASRLRARSALGASDLEGAIAWSARQARGGLARALFVGGGVATAGSPDRRRVAEALAASGIARVDVIASGDVRDDATLRALAGAGARQGVVVDAAAPSAAIAARLLRGARRGVAVEVPGARGSWPASFEGVEDGDERFVYADLPAGVAPRVVVDGREVALAPPLQAPLAARALAKRRIDALVDAGAERDAIVALAKAHRLASPYTAFVVVESDADRVRLAFAGRPLPPPPKAADALLAPAPPIPPPSRGRAMRLAGAHVAKTVSLRMATTVVNGRLPPEAVQGVVRRNFGRFRACYEDGLRRDRALRGRVVTSFAIGRDGAVTASDDAGSELGDRRVVECIVHAFRDLEFPRPEGGVVRVTYPLVLHPERDATDIEEHFQIRAPVPRQRIPSEPPSPPPPPRPWTGAYEAVMAHLADGDVRGAVARAAAARSEAPRDVAALLALGEALSAADRPALAARAYGSIADLHAHRAEMVRLAGARLRRVGPGARPLAIALLRRARDDRPDEPSSHHLLAMALLEDGTYEAAFDALAEGLARGYAARFGTPREVLLADVSLVAAAWRAAEPARASAIDARAFALGAPAASEGASLHLVATWETDASDVALAVDAERGGAWLSSADDGFGPEAYAVGAPPAGAAYHVTLSLARRGPSGDASGTLDVVTHDGRGHVTVTPRPFVIMTDGATVDLGSISPSSGSRAQSPSSRGGSGTSR